MKREERLQRVSELTSTLIDGIASEAEQTELNQLLKGDPEACELYLDLSESHSALIHDHLGDELASAARIQPESHKSSTIPFKLRRSKLRWQAFAAAAGIILLLNASVIYFLGNRQEAEPVAENEWVAVLSRLVEPEWETPKTKYEQGQALAPGSFKLKSGLAQIEFLSGASVIVEGPADLELVSPWLMHCRSGKLQTSVPEPAQGFAIVTPDYRAVDLGTEFSLSVSQTGESELHVVEGEVRLDDESGKELRLLNTGTGIRSIDGIFESLTGGDTSFIDREKMLNLTRADRTSRYQKWLASRDALRSDPATLVLFDFEDQNRWDRQLISRTETASSGAIIGAQWTTGRWPGKGAINFKRIADRVRLKIPGAYQSATLAAWVKVESLDKWYSSLFLTDGFEQGAVHWQISNEGELILGLGGERPANTTSPIIIRPSDLGRWIHLAVTIDQSNKTVTHFVDGEIVEKHRRSNIPELHFGNAEIGNWQPTGNSPQPIRSLNGRLDEFVILSRSMKAAEIQALYAAGLPNG
tara:strand:- start:55 stop:1638 length:1584 start_codon:yes stop_codon:yes gene_type:complete